MMTARTHRLNADTPTGPFRRIKRKATGTALLCSLAVALLLAGSAGGALAADANDESADDARTTTALFRAVDPSPEETDEVETSANAALFGNDVTEAEAEAEADEGETAVVEVETEAAVEGSETTAVEDVINPCPMNPPPPLAEIFEEPNRSAADETELTAMETFAEQKALAYLEGFTVGEYPATEEYDPFSPYCLGVEAFLLAQSEEDAGEPPSYDGTGDDRAVDFYLGYVTGAFPEEFSLDETHPFMQGVEERLYDDPIARAAAEQRAAELAAVAASYVAPSAGVYGAAVYGAVAPVETYVEPALSAVYGEVAPSGAVYGAAVYAPAAPVEETYVASWVEGSSEDVPVEQAPPIPDVDETRWSDAPVEEGPALDQY